MSLHNLINMKRGKQNQIKINNGAQNTTKAGQTINVEIVDEDIISSANILVLLMVKHVTFVGHKNTLQKCRKTLFENNTRTDQKIEQTKRREIIG